MGQVDRHGFPKVADGQQNRQEWSGYEEDMPWAAYDNITVEDTENLELVDLVTNEKDMSRYLFCPREVIGFDLKARRWRK